MVEVGTVVAVHRSWDHLPPKMYQRLFKQKFKFFFFFSRIIRTLEPHYTDFGLNLQGYDFNKIQMQYMYQDIRFTELFKTDSS